MMDHSALPHRFAALTTAHMADACIRAQIPVRCVALRPAVPGGRLAGRVCPVRHAGSVDAFLEAFETASPGDVLVVDNGGRLDEACVGDLIALEAQAAGLHGMVIWGLHRETADLQAIGLPVFSLGTIPTGPLRLDARHPDALESAVVGDWAVSRADLVFGDDDGVVFMTSDRAEETFTLAETIRDTERRQAGQIRAGVSLRRQVQFSAYLARREETPSLSFRDHLRAVGGAIEE
jgi:regulator of RNase E activity RraA